MNVVFPIDFSGRKPRALINRLTAFVKIVPV